VPKLVTKGAGSDKSFPNLWGPFPLREKLPPAKSGLQREFFALALWAFDKAMQQRQAFSRLKRCFHRRRAGERHLAGFDPIVYRLVDRARLGAMLCQNLRLGGHDRRELALQRLDDPVMELLAPAPQQRAVGSVPHQGMLEQIARMWRRALPEQQARL